MGVNSSPKTVTRQRRGCDLNPGPSAPESSMLTTRLPSHPIPPYRYTFTIFRFSRKLRAAEVAGDCLQLRVIILCIESNCGAPTSRTFGRCHFFLGIIGFYRATPLLLLL